MASQEGNLLVFNNNDGSIKDPSSISANVAAGQQQQHPPVPAATYNMFIRTAIPYGQHFHQYQQSAFQKPPQPQPQPQPQQQPQSFGAGRSGSLPPFANTNVNKHQYNAYPGTDYEQSEFEDENLTNKENFQQSCSIMGSEMYLAQHQQQHHHHQQHSARSQFKPIGMEDSFAEFQHPGVNNHHKRPRDVSNTMDTKRARTPVSYFDSTDDDALAGELTDTESKFKFRTNMMAEKEKQGLAIKLPGLGTMPFQVNKLENSAFSQAKSKNTFRSVQNSSFVQQHQQQQNNYHQSYVQQQQQQLDQYDYQQQQIQQQHQQQQFQQLQRQQQYRQQQLQQQQHFYQQQQQQEYLQQQEQFEQSALQDQPAFRAASVLDQQFHQQQLQQNIIQNKSYEEYNQQQVGQSSQLNHDQNSRREKQAVNNFAESYARQQEQHLQQPINPNDPQFLRPLPSFLRFSEGQPARIEIEIVGQPAPVVTWFKDNMIIRNTPDTQITTIGNVHILKMPEIYPEDSGYYKAVLSTQHGKVESVCEVRVEPISKRTNGRADSRMSDARLRRKQRLESEAYHEQTSEQFALSHQKYHQTDLKNDTQSLQGGRVSRVVVEQIQKPKFLKNISNSAFLIGEQAAIQAVAISTPDTDVKFYRNGVMIEPSDNYVISFDYLTGLVSLSIQSASLDDCGQYACVLTNQAGQDTSNCWVVVREPQTNLELLKQPEPEPEPVKEPEPEPFTLTEPVVLEPLQNVEYVEADSALFECKLQGHYLNIDWFKGTQELVNPFRYKMSYDELSGMARLFIATVLKDDAGEYICRVTNPVGQVSTSAQLILLQPPAPPAPEPVQVPEPEPVSEPQVEIFEPPVQQIIIAEPIPTPVPEEPPKGAAKVLKGLKNEQVNEGDTIVLKALIIGNPFPRTAWFKNNKPLVLSQRHFVYEEESKKLSGIKIKNAKPDDSGIYSLVIDNQFGTDDTSAQVLVNAKNEELIEKDIMNPPFFVEHLRISQSLIEGQDTVLTCSWGGNTATAIQWQKDGQVLTPEGIYRIEVKDTSSSLHIKIARKEDSGLFACIIANEAGSNMSRCQVTVSPKQAMAHLTATAESTRGLKRTTNQPEVSAAQISSTLQGLKSTQKHEQVEICKWGEQIDEEESMFNRDKIRPPKFLTQFKPQLDLRERQSARFYAKLIPIGDPTIKFQWLKNGEPIRMGSRYEIKYEFGLVSLDIQWTYPDDDGVYECIASNDAGQDRTKAELKCRPNRLVVYDSQLPEGHSKVQEIEDKKKIATMVKPFVPDDTTPEPSAPEILLKLENLEVREGELAKFRAKILGYPKPRITWFVNKEQAISGTRFRTYFDGMIHYLDILKTNKAEHEGVIRCHAKNIKGESDTTCQLKVIPKLDYWSVLKVTKEDEEIPAEEAKTANKQVKSEAEKSAEEQKPEEKHKQKEHKEHSFLKSKQPIQPKPKPVQVDPRQVPRFMKTLEHKRTKEGGSVEMAVEFEALPPPEIFWYRDGLQMESSLDFNIQSTKNSSTLKIRQCFKTDSGVFQVKLFNSAGYAETRAYLAVIPAYAESNYPVFVVEPKSVETKCNETVTFQVQAKGEPAPQLVWYKDDKKLEFSERINEAFENNIHKIVIKNVVANDAGIYDCLAENVHGKNCTRGVLDVLVEKPVEVKPTPVAQKAPTVKTLAKKTDDKQKPVEQTSAPAPAPTEAPVVTSEQPKSVEIAALLPAPAESTPAPEAKPAEVSQSVEQTPAPVEAALPEQSQVSSVEVAPTEPVVNAEESTPMEQSVSVEVLTDSVRTEIPVESIQSETSVDAAAVAGNASVPEEAPVTPVATEVQLTTDEQNAVNVEKTFTDEDIIKTQSIDLLYSVINADQAALTEQADLQNQETTAVNF